MEQDVHRHDRESLLVAVTRVVSRQEQTGVAIDPDGQGRGGEDTTGAAAREQRREHDNGERHEEVKRARIEEECPPIAIPYQGA